MSSLFIDTSHGYKVGLLDEGFRWSDSFASKDGKSSASIHHQIQEMLTRSGVAIGEIKNLFIANGPGSYTGVRVGEGIGQVFEWQKVKTFSFHHFQIPFLSGVESGVFACPAFKGEYFFYQWERELSGSQELKSVDEIQSLLEKQKIYFSNDPLVEESDCSVEDTNNILTNKSEDVFPRVVELNLREEPFYFRKLKDEFKVAKKKS